MGRITKESAKKYIERESISWLKILFPAFIASFLAPLYYFFDLFSHFALQYVIGGLVLGFTLLYFKRRYWAAVALIIALTCFIESRMHLQEPLRFFPPAGVTTFTIASFNHNVGQSQFQPLVDFLSAPDNKMDFVALIEANDKTAKASEQLKEIYPHQIHEPQLDAFGMALLSRHPIHEHKKLIFNGTHYSTWAARIVIHPPTMENPITVYVMHPLPPTGPHYDEQRNFEMLKIASLVANDASTNKVMIGDWNITPYAPTFGKFLEISGMNFQSYGFLLNPTWPTFLFLPFLQIPIDHVVFSDNLMQLDKKTETGFMSDHKMLIARFAEK